MKFVIEYQNTFFYTFWKVVAASSINQIIYFSTCRIEIFDSFEDAYKQLSKIKDFLIFIENRNVSKKLKQIIKKLEIKELKC